MNFHGQLMVSKDSLVELITTRWQQLSLLCQPKQERKKERKKDFIFHMRTLNNKYTWKEKYPAYAHEEDPL